MNLQSHEIKFQSPDIVQSSDARCHKDVLLTKGHDGATDEVLKEEKTRFSAKRVTSKILASTSTVL
jgi:hypothetical protein